MNNINLRSMWMVWIIVVSLYSLCDTTWAIEQSFTQGVECFVEGESRVQIPEHGESIAFYELVGNEASRYSFKPMAEGGIVLDEVGKLSLTTAVIPQKIMILAVDRTGKKIKKEVELYRANRTLVEDFDFNAPEELEPVVYPFAFVSNQMIQKIRWVLVLGSTLLIGCYFVFKYRARRK